MPIPPALTAEQRSDAAAKSLQLRRERADLKWHLSGGFHFATAFEKDCAKGMKVYTLLRALPGVGEATASRLLDEAGIGRHLSVAQSGPHQAERLFGLVDQLPRR